MANINDVYFDGIYKDLWKSMIPEILTEREVSFMLSYFGLEPGMRVLDLMCGYGRHALALGKKGIHVTAVDNLGDYINEIRASADAEKLPVEAIQADVLEFRIHEKFDLAICMGNSLNFYDRTDTLKILGNLRSSLKGSANFLVNSWSLAEIVDAHFHESSTGEINHIKCETRSTRLEDPPRIESFTRFTDGNRIEEKIAVDYLYSIPDYERMFKESGFELRELFSIPPKKKFEAGDPRAYIIAQAV